MLGQTKYPMPEVIKNSTPLHATLDTNMQVAESPDVLYLVFSLVSVLMLSKMDASDNIAAIGSAIIAVEESRYDMLCTVNP